MAQKKPTTKKTTDPKTEPDGTPYNPNKGYGGSADTEAQNTGTSGQATDEQIKQDRARQRGY